MKRNTWKLVANVAKIVVAVELPLLLWLLPDRTVMDIILICLAQYALFAPIDASVLIKNLKGGA